MALKRNETYPGRFSNPTDDHPQGAFKNRSAPGAQDGSYLEQQWANDWDGFFGRLLTLAEISPNGNVDTASSSQYYDALKSLFLQRANPFADIKADGTVETALENLGLGEAAKRAVGTDANQIPDMGSFEFRNELNGGYVRFPQNWMLQWRKVTVPVASGTYGATVSSNYLIPFTTTVISSWANVESRTISVARSPFVCASNSNLSSFLVTSTYTASQLEVMAYSIGR